MILRSALFGAIRPIEVGKVHGFVVQDSFERRPARPLLAMREVPAAQGRRPSAARIRASSQRPAGRSDTPSAKIRR